MSTIESVTLPGMPIVGTRPAAKYDREFLAFHQLLPTLLAMTVVWLVPGGAVAASQQTFQGLVLAADGTPAAGALVWAAPLPHANTLPPFARVETNCNDQGEFKLSLGPGDWYVWARRGTQGGECHVGYRALTIHADMEPAPARIDLQERGRLRVQLLDADTRKPLAGAKLWIDNGAILTMDADGRAETGGMVRTHHESFVVCPGRLRQRILFDTSGQHDTDLQLQIRRGATVQGRITDVAGQPIPGAYVGKWTSGSWFSLSGLHEPCRLDGSFAWHGAAIDRPERLDASAPGFVSDELDGRLVSAEKGTTELQFKLKPCDAPKPPAESLPRLVTGTVKNADGQPMAGVGIRWNEGAIPVFTNADGRFVLDGVPDRFVWLRLNGPLPIPVFPKVKSGGHQHIQVKITAGHSAGGIVVDELGTALVGASIMPILAHNAPGEQGHLRVWERPIKTDATGRFRLTNLPDECYASCFLEDYEYESECKLQLDQGINRITLVACGGIRGRVIDPNGKPVRNFRILLDSPRVRRPNQRGGGWFAGYSGIGVNFTNDEGRFTLTGFNADSDLRVIAVSPDYLEGAADRVTTKPIKRLTPDDEFTIQLMPAKRLTVSVVDHQNKPMVDARVALLRGRIKFDGRGFQWGSDDDSWADEIRVRTRGDGTAKIDSLTMNEATILLQSPGCGRQHIDWDGKSDKLKIIAQPEAIIKGRILDTNGRPQAKVNIRLVYFEDGTIIWATADQEGRFEFTALTPGKVELTTGHGQPVILGQLTLKSGETTTQEWRVPDEAPGAGQLKLGVGKKK